MPVSARSERQQGARDRGDEKQPAHCAPPFRQYRAVALRPTIRDTVAHTAIALCRTTAAGPGASHLTPLGSLLRGTPRAQWSGRRGLPRRAHAASANSNQLPVGSLTMARTAVARASSRRRRTGGGAPREKSSIGSRPPRSSGRSPMGCRPESSAISRVWPAGACDESSNAAVGPGDVVRVVPGPAEDYRSVSVQDVHRVPGARSRRDARCHPGRRPRRAGPIPLRWRAF